MEPNVIALEPKPIRDFQLIEGESRQLRSNYYQQMVKYTRSLIRVLNGKYLTADMESYCYRQLHITKLEMTRVRKSYFIYIQPEPTNDGPTAS